MQTNPGYNILSFSHLVKHVIRHWQWYILSMVICLCVAQLYIFYVTPVYKMSCKLLIKQADNYNHQASSRYLYGISNVGTVTNTEGIENETQKIWTSTLMRDVVMNLKLYTDYRKKGWPKYQTVYATQPISVDLDLLHLDSIDKIAYDDFCTIEMRLSRVSMKDSTIRVGGVLTCNDEITGKFSRKIKSLPATIKTAYGTLTLTKNPQGGELKADDDWYISISPPLYKALVNLGKLNVKNVKLEYDTERDILRYYYKMTSIVELSLTDPIKQRGIDILNQVAISYNSQATADKNEIALRTEEFINGRLNLLKEQLETVEDSVVDIKQSSGVTTLSDAALSRRLADKYAGDVSETETQLMTLSYLDEYIHQPENKYTIIPSNIGMSNSATTKMIDQYNRIIQNRNRLLKSATDEAPQVKQLTSSADELRSAITEALQQEQYATKVHQKSAGAQYANYKHKVYEAPVAERGLTDAARQKKVMVRLYRRMLRIRENNSIRLSSTADHGQLIDEPVIEGKVRPNLLYAYGIAASAGIAIPYIIFFLLKLLNYKIRSRKELERLTELPIIADIPLLSESAKEKAGIVVRSGLNVETTERFHSLRTNIGFILEEKENVILFTSTTSGEGKTFNAANLAMSYALTGKRVVLCGLDIRKPALGKLFGLKDHTKGISLLLSQKGKVTEADVENQIQESGIDHRVHLLLAGPVPPNPAEMLARDNMASIVSILREKYDYVILDTAPVGLVTDTLHVGRYADMTIYVCRVDYTPRYSVMQLNMLAEEKKLPKPYFVLNGVRS